MLAHTLETAIRVLLRRKVFTAVSLFGVALTLVILVVTAALLDHTFGPLPPEVNGDRSLGVFFVTMRGKDTTWNGWPGYRLLDENARALPGAEAESFFSVHRVVSVWKGGQKRSLWLKRTDAPFWSILRFRFLEGGPFTAEDDRVGNAVAVVNETTRRTLFGPGSALGKTVELEGRAHRVVGVVEDVPFLRVVPFADAWIPLRSGASDAYRREYVGDFVGLVMARSRGDLPAIREEWKRRLSTVRIQGTDRFDKVEAEIETLLERAARVPFGAEPERAALLVALTGALAVLFMLLPALNLVNLAVSRILERAPEIGVRKAFGASSGRLVLQFVTENLVLCLAGGCVGLLASTGVLAAINASGAIPYAHLVLNLRVFLVGLALAGILGVLSGAYPAYRMSRLHPVEALKGGPR